MILLTLLLIFSIAIVSAIDTDSSDNQMLSVEKSVNQNIFKINHPPENHHELNDLSPTKKSVSKDFDFFGIFDFLFKGEKKYGYWVWSGDMDKVDFDKLSKNGVNIVFLNSYAFKDHGYKDVMNWIKKANDHGIEVHIWMQIFNTGDWISPVKNGTPNTGYFNYKIEEAKYYAGLEGVSGLQMDYIRYEGNAYKDPNGTAAINEFVKNYTKSVKEVKPSLTVSATVMPEANATYYYGQDIPKMGEYVDVIVPMMYKGNYESDSEWIKNTTDWIVKNSGDAKVWVGLQTYQSDFNVTDMPADELLKDGKFAFDNGADGVIYFKWGMNEELDNKKLN